jgi:hypothetical protein
MTPLIFHIIFGDWCSNWNIFLTAQLLYIFADAGVEREIP